MVLARSTEPGRRHPRPCHIVAVPYPGRGHINPMLNLCKIIASRSVAVDDHHPQLLITFVLTEEWFGVIGSDPKPANIRFATIPNVLPSELVRAANMCGFFEAVQTKMEEPFEELLDRIQIDQAPVTVIIAEVFLQWAVDIGNRKDIPVALLWPMSAAAFSIFYHFELLLQNGHFPYDLPARGEEIVDYIPGIPSILLADLPTVLQKENFDQIQATFPNVQRAQYLLFTSIFELESHIIDALKPKFSIPLYSLGPLIPHYNLGKTNPCGTQQEEHHYFEWLDSQPPNSVLYISMGSFLSASHTQTEEITAGLRDSGIRFLWVARGDTSRLQEICGQAGLIVPWCAQLEVLCHPAVGGFWTHCGWNSTMECVFAGVPMLTSPIVVDQLPNSKLIVEDWRVGWRVKRSLAETMLKREEIAVLVKQFMSFDSIEGKEMVAKVTELRDISRKALKGGSSEANLNAFLANIGIL